MVLVTDSASLMPLRSRLAGSAFGVTTASLLVATALVLSMIAPVAVVAVELKSNAPVIFASSPDAGKRRGGGGGFRGDRPQQQSIRKKSKQQQNHPRQRYDLSPRVDASRATAETTISAVKHNDHQKSVESVRRQKFPRFRRAAPKERGGKKEDSTPGRLRGADGGNHGERPLHVPRGDQGTGSGNEKCALSPHTMVASPLACASVTPHVAWFPACYAFCPASTVSAQRAACTVAAHAFAAPLCAAAAAAVPTIPNSFAAAGLAALTTETTRSRTAASTLPGRTTLKSPSQPPSAAVAAQTTGSGLETSPPTDASTIIRRFISEAANSTTAALGGIIRTTKRSLRRPDFLRIKRIKDNTSGRGQSSKKADLTQTSLLNSQLVLIGAALFMLPVLDLVITALVRRFVVYKRRGVWRDDPRFYIIETRMRMVKRTERRVRLNARVLDRPTQEMNPEAVRYMDEQFPSLAAPASSGVASASTLVAAPDSLSPTTSPRARSPTNAGTGAASRLPGGSMSPPEHARVNPGQQLGSRSVSTDRAASRDSHEWLLVDDEGNSTSAPCPRPALTEPAFDAPHPTSDVAGAAHGRVADDVAFDDTATTSDDECCPTLVPLDWDPYHQSMDADSASTRGPRDHATGRARPGVPPMPLSGFVFYGAPPTDKQRKVQ
jgi:hypothetical protein